jgi:hypothetical protein
LTHFLSKTPIHTLLKIPTLRKKMAYIPFAGGVGGPRIGLSPLPDDKPWFEFDEDESVQLELRSRLLDADQSCCQFLPGSEPAVREVVSHIAEWLRKERGQHIPEWEGLFGISKRIQDDLCIMHEDRLVAASVCFPTGWNLDDKLGKGSIDIHEGVSEPEFRAVLKTKMDALNESLLWRLNWFVYPDTFLRHDFQNPLLGPNPPPVTRENAGSRLFIRYERQTLRRFPETGAVLFTIRVYIDPLRTLKEEHPEHIQDFVTAYTKYKADGSWVKPMFDYLEM